MSTPALKKQKLDKPGAAASIPKGGAQSSSKRKGILKQAKAPQPPADEVETPSSSNHDDSDGDGDDNDSSDPESSGAEDFEDDDDEFDFADEEGGRGGKDGEDEDDLDGLVPRTQAKKRKRNDPDAFSTSMAKILSSHLTTTARKDPILVRSKKAAQQIDESRLEAKARRLLALEHKAALEKGRIRDVIPQGDADGEQVKAAMEKEKALRKLAQRGVIKLFNAVRAAQVTGARALQDSKSKGMIGIDARDKKVTEMSKQGFLDLIRTTSQAKA